MISRALGSRRCRSQTQILRIKEFNFRGVQAKYQQLMKRLSGERKKNCLPLTAESLFVGFPWSHRVDNTKFFIVLQHQRFSFLLISKISTCDFSIVRSICRPPKLAPLGPLGLSQVNRTFFDHRSLEHEVGSLESVVSKLIKNWVPRPSWEGPSLGYLVWDGVAKCDSKVGRTHHENREIMGIDEYDIMRIVDADGKQISRGYTSSNIIQKHMIFGLSLCPQSGHSRHIQKLVIFRMM